MITIKVLGNPVAQGRPRFYRRGDHVGTYDPEKSKSWKETVKWQAIEQGVRCLEGAITMKVDFHLPRPKSLPKRVKHHTKRPDLDNLLKSCKDALNGIAYKDDSQIVALHVTKHYAVDTTGVVINLVEYHSD